MRVIFYPEEDAMYVKLSEEPFAYGRDLDDKRHLNFSENGEVIGVEFLSVGDGVDLNGISEKVKHIIIPLLDARNVKIYAT